MPFPALNAFEQKVAESEAEAAAHVEVSGEMEDIEKEIRQIEADHSVDDELKALKDKMKKDK